MKLCCPAVPPAEDGHRLPLCSKLYGNCEMADLSYPRQGRDVQEICLFFTHTHIYVYVYNSKVRPGVHSPGVWTGDAAQLRHEERT